jgi:hypothetical protein
MAKARNKAAHPTLPLGPPQSLAPAVPQIGDRVIPERSDSEWKISEVRYEGKYVNLELPGTNLTRRHVDVSTLEFIERVAPTTVESFRNPSAISKRIATIQRESLERLDEDIAVLKKYMKTEDAPTATIVALDTLSNELHASWQAAVERIDELIEGIP